MFNMLYSMEIETERKKKRMHKFYWEIRSHLNIHLNFTLDCRVQYFRIVCTRVA